MVVEYKSLYDGTRDLHHACERHPVGAGMSNGKADPQWWADWLGCLLTIHEELDKSVPHEEWKRVDELKIDIKGSQFKPRENKSAKELATVIAENPVVAEAAQYVITGAHIMGGQVAKKKNGDRLPTAHLQYANRKELQNQWEYLRDRLDLVDGARFVFECLLKCMDEIINYDRAEYEDGSTIV